ncbi:MAG: heme exporter protein CcmB [candidate division KSB1 bacterium]|nr:heme exporter protein CcmB [candidate division KSB1 bacterium]MDZ7273152.1 heme exporter protein CcmB [candidate division KSB1 bacterium]MDZ7285254.1 heme exporter protein CcmB [candidate division KSB1 bacterium]MDZ7298286.1 heme exporter protein CcmB [candidate division KSB1 bacterium]MDZ7349081.1 heme exporter protein CcmB [candidate division KSB1 bacterium]
MNALAKLWAVVWKDLLSEFRTKELLSSMLMFALIVVVIFSFTFETGSTATREAGPGLLWVAFTFASVLGLHRSMVHEVERGSLHGLLIAPLDRGLLFLAKAIGNVIFIFLIEIPTFVLFGIFFNVDLTVGLDKTVVVFLLGTIGFAAVGTLFSAMSVNTRTREIMLPILLFPIQVPVILAAVQATAGALTGRTWAELADWLKILIAFDAVFLIVCFVTFEYVLEE